LHRSAARPLIFLKVAIPLGWGIVQYLYCQQ